MLRLGAMEYEPALCVKKHTLDERLQQELFSEKIFVLKERIANC
jgi:hypothetical protein